MTSMGDKMWRVTLFLTFCYVVLVGAQYDYHFEMPSGRGRSPWNGKDNDYYYDPLNTEDSLPTFTTPAHSDHSATQGDSIILPCVVKKLGEFNLTWRHGDKILLVMQEGPVGPLVSRVSEDPRVELAGTSLSLSDVQAKDNGIYVCEVGVQPPRNISHTLVITVPPTIYPANNRSVVTVKNGNNITLACRTQGSPTPTITWSSKGRNVSGLLRGSNLSITRARPEDNGIYQCSADNGARKVATANITLQVMYPPRVHAESKIEYGGVDYEATLVCVVEGEPTPKVNWFKGGIEPVNPFRLTKAVDAARRYSLQFKIVQRDDFDDYTCNATNFMGNASAVISLLGRPKPVRYYSPVQGEKESTYTLVWQVESYTPVLTYNIAYKNESDVEEQWVNFTVPGTTSSSHFHSSSHTFTQLEPGATYHVQVTAINEYGESDVNQTFTFTTFNPVPEKDSASESLEQPSTVAPGSAEVKDTTGNLTLQEGPISTKKVLGKDSAAAAVQDGASGSSSYKLTPAEKRAQMVAFVTAITLSCFFY